MSERLESRRLLAAVGSFDTGGGFAGGDSALAYDDAGTLHLAYYDSADENLKYASRPKGGAWGEMTTLDDGRYAGLYADVATHGDRVAVSYFDGWAADLKVALFDGIGGGGWVTRTLDTGSADTEVTGLYTSAAFGNDDTLFVSYYDQTAGSLRLAELSVDDEVTLSTPDGVGGGGWGDVGRHSSLAINPDTGGWLIAYEATDAGEVRLVEQVSTDEREQELIDRGRLVLPATRGGGCRSRTCRPAAPPLYRWP